MTTTPAGGDDTRETTTENGIPAMKAFALGAHRVWGGLLWAGTRVFIWSVMLSLPLVYKERLASHSRDLGERLPLHQPTAHAPASALHILEESEFQLGKRFVKRCVLEWRVFATLNVAILGLAVALLPVLNGQLLTRTLLYSTFACALVAFVIGSVSSVHLEYVQDTRECSLWLSHASRHDLLIEFHVLLAVPLTWSIWGLGLFTASLVSYIWTYPGEVPTPPMGSGDMESMFEAWRFWWITLPTAILIIGLWNFWLLWMIFSQLSKPETEAPPVQAPASSTQYVVPEHPGPRML